MREGRYLFAVHLFIYGPTKDETIYDHITRLANSICTIHRLIIIRVPTWINYVVLVQTNREEKGRGRREDKGKEFIHISTRSAEVKLMPKAPAPVVRRKQKMSLSLLKSFIRLSRSVYKKLILNETNNKDERKTKSDEDCGGGWKQTCSAVDTPVNPNKFTSKFHYTRLNDVEHGSILREDEEAVAGCSQLGYEPCKERNLRGLLLVIRKGSLRGVAREQSGVGANLLEASECGKVGLGLVEGEAYFVRPKEAGVEVDLWLGECQPHNQVVLSRGAHVSGFGRSFG